MSRTGRPKTFIDLEQAEKLGALQCTYAECAAFLTTPERKISEGFLKSRRDFIDSYKKGFSVGKISLRRTQFRLAEKSAAMAIWLGKQYLGQTEKNEVVIPDAGKYFEQIANAIMQSDTNTNSVLPRST